MAEDENQSCWSDLPIDLLRIILSHLCFLDHLSFRGVCKQWHLALTIFPTVEYQASSVQPLWFMEPSIPNCWIFGDPSTKRIYNIHLPELSWKTTRILVSKHGWILAFSTEPSSSLFFFNPFSRARIDLPWSNNFSNLTILMSYRGSKRDRPKLYNIPVFVVGASPTSPDCTVYAMSYVDGDKILVTYCHRARPFDMTSGIFGDGTRVRSYSYMVESEDGKVSICIDFLHRPGKMSLITPLSPFNNIRDRIQVEILPWNNHKYRLNYDVYTTPLPDWLRLDSFPIGSWSFLALPTDPIPPRQILSLDLHHKTDPPDCAYWGDTVWIEPKWIEPSLATAWTT
ncbi:F-box protein At4g12382-like isoform X1 [Fagus crenata]